LLPKAAHSDQASAIQGDPGNISAPTNDEILDDSIDLSSIQVQPKETALPQAAPPQSTTTAVGEDKDKADANNHPEGWHESLKVDQLAHKLHDLSNEWAQTKVRMPMKTK
jgi:hypothetical protein